ncbi:hypothetical protein [Vibrio owensii]|uniref:hypothetical protein n=1 Tax=Vibrio owensii TaxID=696485 RepID=UPI0005ED6A84|nr:hypothetical protein [Vibrio owensii]
MMWEMVSYLLGLSALLLIAHYFSEPKKLKRDIQNLFLKNERLKALEQRVAELEKQVESKIQDQ